MHRAGSLGREEPPAGCWGPGAFHIKRCQEVRAGGLSEDSCAQSSSCRHQPSGCTGGTRGGADLPGTLTPATLQEEGGEGRNAPGGDPPAPSAGKA